MHRSIPRPRGSCPALLLVLGLGLAACGGGGGGSNGTEPPPPLSRAQLVEASRFASQASFGLPWEEIRSLAREGREAWLERQFALPAGYHTPIVDELVARRNRGDFAAFEQDIEYLVSFRRMAWWHRAVTSPDVLRQRVAFALSEIFVVSDKVDALLIHPDALSGYYDTLLEHAFGNFRDLLRAVTLSPAMGIYLSHVNNRKADPARNTFPDENYAREVMQLFSIGLFELNIDGSVKTDVSGRPLPTYDNDDIREFAKVFTGLSYGGPGAFFGKQEPWFRDPMQMFDSAHEPGEKRLLNGVVVPPGQSGMQDIEQAIDVLFNHPNTGPFIGRQLIQRLVTSNPSPAYVERVARAFNGDATGLRGDMRAVIRAVLLDPEAEAGEAVRPDFGKLREPVVRYAGALRQLHARSDDGFIGISGYLLEELGRQHPLSAPSVFNFFLPSHSPAGELADAGLVAPEFEITTSSSIVGVTNLADLLLFAPSAGDVLPPFSQVQLDLADLLPLADDLPALVERLDILLAAGALRPGTRSAIESLLAPIDDRDLRVRLAIYMVLASADYAVRS
ncbi:MAG: DUF1800 domain-containing protein [Gammaproteobacteria bacterium]|nr:MAG: DUF1800 domain-containing protein [Gammaproteobacteria bacterium]